ncbi:MAG: DUF4421 family protein [Bacteroidota bacterium]
MGYFRIFLIAAFFLPVAGKAIAPGDSLKPVKTYNYDTNYIRKYPERLVIALYQSSRHYDIKINQMVTPDTFPGKHSLINYFADANNASGISVDYDIIGFGFSYKTVSAQPESKVGKSTYYSYSLNFNTRGFRIENSIKRYKGFYDIHSPVYDSAYSDSTRYYQNPSMKIFTLKTKVFYMFNKKRFSLSSAYANTARQLKTAGTFLLVGNVYGYNMTADSSIIPRPIQHFYGSVWNDMNKMKVFGMSGGCGYSANLVLWKRFYFNFLLSLGLEMQHRQYTTFSGDGSLSIWQPSLAGDWRASLGFNNRNFFIRIANVIDYNYFYTDKIKIDQQFISGEFTFGYRFRFKTPRPYQKFKDTEIYKKYF